jgi:hypothetical protein
LAGLVFVGGYFGSVVVSFRNGDEFRDEAGLEFKEVFIEGGARTAKGGFEFGSDTFLFDDVRSDKWLGGAGSDFEVFERGMFVQNRGDGLVK